MKPVRQDPLNYVCVCVCVCVCVVGVLHWGLALTSYSETPTSLSPLPPSSLFQVSSAQPHRLNDSIHRKGLKVWAMELWEKPGARWECVLSQGVQHSVLAWSVFSLGAKMRPQREWRLKTCRCFLREFQSQEEPKSTSDKGKRWLRNLGPQTQRRDLILPS